MDKKSKGKVGTMTKWQASKRPRVEVRAISIEEMDDDLLHLANPPPVDEKVVGKALEAAHDQLVSLKKNMGRRLMELSWNDIHIKRIMGVGGFAVVSLAKVPKIEKIRKNSYWFAVKCMHEDSIRDDAQFVKAARDLCTEAALLKKLWHPNIIELYGVAGGDDSRTFHQPGGYFLVLQCMKGTLNAMLRKWRQLPQQAPTIEYRLSNIAYQIANAMDYLHENKIVYRDLKPGNVGVDYDGNVRLFDFGLARQLSDGESCVRGCTGSLRYMAPEVLIEHEASFPSDVFSYAILLWEVLALAKPYRRHGMSSSKDYKEAVGHSGLRPSPQPAVGVALTALISECWREDPTRRPGFGMIKERLREEVDRRKRSLRSTATCTVGALCMKKFLRPIKGRRIMSTR